MSIRNRPTKCSPSRDSSLRRGKQRRGSTFVPVGLVALLLSVQTSTAQTSAQPAPAEGEDFLAECRAQIEHDPEDPEGYSCIFRVARQGARWREAATAVARLRGRLGSAPWWEMTLGNLAWASDPGVALDHYRRAAEGFSDLEQPRGEVLARYNLRNLLMGRGELDAAGAQVELAVAAAETSDEPDVLAQALLLQANHLMETGGDLARAQIALRRAERAAFPDGSYSLKRNSVVTHANLLYRLGEFEQALTSYRRAARLAADNEDPLEAATAAYNIANVRLRQLELRPEPGGIAEVERLGREALELARANQMLAYEARSYRLLGDLLWRSGDLEAGLRSLQDCLTVARRLDDPERELSCLLSRAEALAIDDPAAAERDSLAALELAEVTGNDRYLAYAWRARMRVAWQILEPRAALEESVRALSAIERLRDTQRETEASVGVFSAWTDDYYWLAGRVLEEPGLDATEAADTAFALAERMRGRRLLEDLARGPRDREPPADAAAGLDERRAIRAQIVALQRRLLRPGLESALRRELLGELARLEVDERAVLQSIRDSSPRGSESTEGTELTDISSVRASLAEDQAMLYFLVGLERDAFGQPAGGAWLWVITRDSQRVVAIPDRMALESQVPVFVGALERRDRLADEIGAALYRGLLGSALDELAPRIERLVVVPDGALHHLPFAALRPSRERDPMGTETQLAITPSATLWQRWHGLEVPVSRAPALVVAAPRLPATAQSPSGEPTTRASGLGDGAALGPLPGARREGRAVRRALGRGTRLLTGDDASELAVKNEPTADFDVVHFAAHAVADEAHPHRSCVVLAPGGDEEDGLLQVAEAERLDLDGRVVVLSACSTAAGEVRGGEGVLSLARAFFRAGARTVVATRWPARDDEAARFFDRFYARLAEGETVGAAVMDARRDLHLEGLPTAAWAGVVVLGDDASRLQHLRTGPSAAVILAIGLGVLVVIAACVWIVGRRLGLRQAG